MSSLHNNHSDRTYRVELISGTTRLMGAARDFLLGGQLWRFKLSDDRRDLVFSDARLADRVADNLDKFDLTESESLLFGTGFGISTDIVTGPNGHLFVLSLSQGAIYEISRGAP